MSYEESIAKAKSILMAAQLCLQHGYYDSAVSRGYFAMLWTAIAALEKVGVDLTGTRRAHERVQSELGLNIVTGRLVLPRNSARHLNQMRVWREKADYMASEISTEEAGQILTLATNFLSEVEGNGGSSDEDAAPLGPQETS